ncbi:MAG: AAA family ATPase, partial [Thermoplasmatota archaeon]
MEDISARLTSDVFEFIVIFGRRRVGKTRLVLESVKEMDHIYYLATMKDNLKEFRNEVSDRVPEIMHSAEDWISTIRLLKDRIVILDEFPYMIREDPSLTSIFQKIIDSDLADTRTKLIILGSSITMMTDQVMNYTSPLYGRRTSTIDLGPLRFSDLIEYYPDCGIEDLCLSFAISDGIPYYMEKVQPPIWSWLDREMRKTDTFLKEEVDFLLKYEFTDHGNYKKILNAIAHGRNKPSEIRNHCGMKHADIMPYLRNLMNVRLVKRELPIGASERSKSGRYFLSDNLLAFWF